VTAQFEPSLSAGSGRTDGFHSPGLIPWCITNELGGAGIGEAAEGHGRTMENAGCRCFGSQIGKNANG